MRHVLHADFLRDGDEAVHAHFGHRLMRALHGVDIEFHPAGIRQLDETAGGGGEPFEVRLAELETSASHSADTASQSMPLPLTMSRGLSWRGCRNRRCSDLTNPAQAGVHFGGPASATNAWDTVGNCLGRKAKCGIAINRF